MVGTQLVQCRCVVVVFFLARHFVITVLACLLGTSALIELATEKITRRKCNICSIPPFGVSSLIDAQMVGLQVSYVDGGMEDQEESGNMKHEVLEALLIPKVSAILRAIGRKTTTAPQS